MGVRFYKIFYGLFVPEMMQTSSSAFTFGALP